MHAIETVYKGWRFRSRLEARWAVFFDTLGFRWEYEQEGFDIDGTWYLPDFWLADIQCYAEVKPGKFDERSYKLACACGCLMLEGSPDIRWYAWAGSFKEKGERFPPYTCYPWGCDNFWWHHIHFPYSLYKQRPWLWSGEDIRSYDNTGFQKAVYAARQARFTRGQA